MKTARPATVWIAIAMVAAALAYSILSRDAGLLAISLIIATIVLPDVVKLIREYVSRKEKD